MLTNRPPLTASIATVLVAGFLIQPLAIYGQGIQSAAERELERRQQREVVGRSEADKGKAALRARDYETAFGHYKNACEAIAKAPATSGSLSVAVGGFTEAGLKLAEQRVTEGYYASAVDVLKEVLKHNPNSTPVHRLLSNIEAPDYFNKKMSPQHRAKIEEVKQHHLDAQQYQDLGRLGLAEQSAEKALNADKYNKAAELRRQAVAEEKLAFGQVAYNSTRAIAVAEVANQWQRPYRRFDRVAKAITESTKSDAPNTVRINKKLQSIILPSISFNETTIREAIQFLQQKSKQLDPDKEGVNIVLKLEEGAGGGSGAPAPIDPAGGGIPGLPADPGAAPAPVAPAVGGGSGDTKVTLSLNNVPLIEALKYITNLANLKFKVDPYAVTVVPISTNIEQMFTKEWKVRPDFLNRIPNSQGAGGGLGAVTPDAGAGVAAGGTLGTASTAKDTLLAAGVQFPPGSMAIYSKSTSTLTVRNNSEQLDLIEKIVESIGTDTGVTQVEIQAKFVEITQNNLKELSFDWLLGQSNFPGVSTYNLFTAGGTQGTSPGLNPSDFVFTAAGTPLGQNPITGGNRSGQLAISANAIDALLFGTQGNSRLAPGVLSLVGARTDPQFQLIMRGLDQNKGVDLLSAPRVTTKSGQRAVIEIIREFRYPTEFEAPQIPQDFGALTANTNIGNNPLAFSDPGSFPVTPTTPTAFETKNTGVTLEVEPQIGPDGYSIDMQLAPQVVEFEGFINYGSPIQTTSSNALGQQIVNVITPNIINQPIFATRKISTNITVFDGSTVVLGGLVREDVQSVKDKTPLLGDLPVVGRLFRSNVDQHIKRNLVIFVTAKLVNPAGEALISDDEREEKVEELGLPEAPMPALPDVAGYRK